MAAKPSRRVQWIAGFGAHLGGFALGNVIGWSSPAMEPVTKLLNISDTDFSWISSIMPLGAATSQISTAVLMDLLGRKWLMIATSIPLIAAWCALAFANNKLMFYIGRFFCGFCAATYCVVSPTYTGEFADKDIRGTLGGMFQFLLVIGILTTFCLGEFKNNIFLTLPHIGFLVLLIVIIIFLPESPVFLYKIGKVDKARKSLQIFRGKDYNIDDEMAGMEEYTKKGTETFWEAFKKKANMKGFALLLVLQVLQQLSGINAVMFYSHLIFMKAGGKLSPGANTMLLGAVQVVFTAISAYIVDKVGRKLLWLISLSTMCICSALIGMYFFIQNFNENAAKSIAFIPTIAVCLYMAGFSFGAGPLPWTMMGEMLPVRIKGQLAASAAFLNWMLAYFISQTFPILAEIFGVYTMFWAFAIVCGLGVPYVMFFLIETKGKTLEQIQAELAG